MSGTAASAPAPAAPAPQGAPEVGSRANPAPHFAPGGKGRSDSRTAATAPASSVAVKAMLRDMRSAGDKPAAQPADAKGTRDAFGRFVKHTSTADTEPATKPGEQAEKPAAEVKAETKPEAKAEQKPAETKPDPRLTDMERQVKQSAERDEKWRQASREAAEKIADAEDQAAHYKDLFEQARGLIRQLSGGRDIDQRDLEAAELRLKLKRAERSTTQHHEAQQRAVLDSQTRAIVSRTSALVAKHPELDPKASQEAAQFWRSYLATAPSLATMEDDAAAYATLLRARAHAAHQKATEAAQPEVAKPTPRPAADIPEGGASPTGKPASLRQRMSDKQIKEDMRQWRVVNGGRG